LENYKFCLIYLYSWYDAEVCKIEPPTQWAETNMYCKINKGGRPCGA